MNREIETKGSSETDKFDIAGILTTYLQKCLKANSNKQLKDILEKLIRELKKEVSK